MSSRALWRRAKLLLQSESGEAMMLGMGWVGVTLLFLFIGSIIQFAIRDAALPLNAADWILFGALPVFLAASIPVRMESMHHLGAMTGVLDENDCGFLNCTPRLHIWGRAFLLHIMNGLLFAAACIPAILLLIGVRILRVTMPVSGDAMLQLLTMVHLMLMIPIAAMLPLRVYTVSTALPYALLKMPQCSPLSQMRLAFRLTRRQTGRILSLRLICLPALILPFPAVTVLPTLLTTDLLRCKRNFDRLEKK